MTRSTSRGCPSVGEAPTQRGRTRAAACAGSPVCTRGSVRAGGGLALAENILVIILSPSQTWEPPLLNQKRCQQAPSGAAAWLRGVGSQSSFVQKSARGLERKKIKCFFLVKFGFCWPGQTPGNGLSRVRGCRNRVANTEPCVAALPGEGDAARVWQQALPFLWLVWGAGTASTTSNLASISPQRRPVEP